MRRPHLWIWIGLGIGLLPLLLAGGRGLGAGAAHQPLTREELLSCGRCHSMEQEVAAWQAGPHADLACLQCHQAGDPNWVRHEFSDRSEQMAAAARGPFHQTLPIKLEAERCVECHAPQQEALMQDRVPVPLQPASAGAGTAPGRTEAAPGAPMATRALHHLHMNEGPGLDCIDCHAVHTAPAERTDRTHSRCLTCHEAKQVQIAAPGSSGCGACHLEPATVAPESHRNESLWLDRHGAAAPVQMCGQCHLAESAGPHGPLGDPARFPPAGDACAACHAGVPMPHREGYLAEHGTAATTAPQTCERCHTPAGNPVSPAPAHAGATFCKDCHLQPMPHPESYLGVHGAEALQAPATCGACHSSRNLARPAAAHASQSFCANCHNGFQHQTGWVGTHGSKVDGSCGTCHALPGQSGGHNACAECHTPSGQWHPPMWFVSHARAIAAEGEAGCARCHDQVQPACSQCHRSR